MASRDPADASVWTSPRTGIPYDDSSDDEDVNGQDNDDSFDKEKMKNMISNAWNNVKYGFNVPYKPTFNDSSPVWFLGRCYHSRNYELDAALRVTSEEHRVLSLDQFFQDFSALVWLTYRKQFPQLQNSLLTTDSGWGCMLRTGQMLLANTILNHMLSGRWKRVVKFHSTEQHYIYRMILRFFNDEPSSHSPLSLHHMVELGEELGYKAGSWYGPSSVSLMLRNAVSQATNPYLKSLCVYVAQDCTVYIDDVVELCAPTMVGGNVEPWKSVLIMVPVRLGGERFNHIYIPCIKALLTLDHCMGIIGGRPSHSLYFVGFQDNKLINLDPHYCQSWVDMNDDLFPTESFHCQYPRKMSVRKMDPSCSIGFYCRTRKDFDDFCKHTVERGRLLNHVTVTSDHLTTNGLVGIEYQSFLCTRTLAELNMAVEMLAAKPPVAETALLMSVLKPPLQRSEYPMFVISKGKSPAHDFNIMVSGLHRPGAQSSTDGVPSSSKSAKNSSKKQKKKARKTRQLSVDEYVVV